MSQRRVLSPMALSPKHQAFVAEYLICWNTTEAYRRVYPKSSDNAARAHGARLVANGNIAEAIRQHLEAKAMSAAEVVSRLSEQGRADLGDYLSDYGEIDIAAMKAAGATHLLRKVKRTVRRGISKDGGEWQNETLEVELLDPQKALELLGKYHKLFTDKMEHQGEITLRVVYEDGSSGTDDQST